MHKCGDATLVNNILKSNPNWKDEDWKRQELTHRLDELKLFALLDLLDEADVLQAGADEVPLLHLHRRVRLQKK